MNPINKRRPKLTAPKVCLAMDDAIMAEVVRLAREQGRTVSAVVRRALRQALGIVPPPPADPYGD